MVEKAYFVGSSQCTSVSGGEGHSPLPGFGEERGHLHKENLMPTFSQTQGGQVRLPVSAISQLPSAKIIPMPKWRVLG